MAAAIVNSSTVQAARVTKSASKQDTRKEDEDPRSSPRAVTAGRTSTDSSLDNPLNEDHRSTYQSSSVKLNRGERENS